MHEFSIVRALLRRVDEEARTRRATAVRRVCVQVGELSGVEVSLLQSAFDVLRAGTCCDRSDLEVVPVAVAWSCSDCGEAIAAGGLLRCPRCGAPARLEAGSEILLERIDLEVN